MTSKTQNPSPPLRSEALSSPTTSTLAGDFNSLPTNSTLAGESSSPSSPSPKKWSFKSKLPLSRLARAGQFSEHESSRASRFCLLASMFGGVLSVPVNNPHLRKSGSKLIVTNLGENDSMSASMLLGSFAKLRSPLLLKTHQER